MALLFCDNFENWTSTSNTYPGPWHAALGSFDSGPTAANVNSNQSGIFQTHATVSSASYLAFGFPSKATIICNFRASLGIAQSGDDNTNIITFRDGDTVQASLVHQTNGHLGIWRGTSTAMLGESINAFAFDATTYLDIEVKITIHNTTGAAEVKVNGATEINITTVNLRMSTNNTVNEARIGKAGSGIISSKTIPFFDHFILMDTTGSVMNDFIGPVDISSLRPSADGNYTTWTALAGDRWDAVNDAVTDADATYVHANTATNKVSFAMTDLPVGVTDVFGVFGQSQLTREQGTTRITQMFVRAGGTDQAIGSTLAIGPTYAFRNAVATLNPHTAAAWTVAEVNALELGMEITT